jgi:hypothetical protein
MPMVAMDLPEDVFSALRQSPEEFAREMRLAAAMLWYSRSMISQEKAAEIAGKNYNRPVEMVIFVALIYFVICYSLSFVVKRLQQRFAIKR